MHLDANNGEETRWQLHKNACNSTSYIGKLFKLTNQTFAGEAEMNLRDVPCISPTHGRAKAGRPARTYIQQLCEDTGCCPDTYERYKGGSGISVLPYDDDDDS